MRRYLAVPSLLLFLAFSAAAATLPELFMKAKEQFKAGNYKEALSTVETLDAESAKPGLEAERRKILPGLLFYKGASLAALGRKDEAVEAFGAFLELQPNASLDPALYPPKVIAAFDAARKAAAPAAPIRAGRDGCAGHGLSRVPRSRLEASRGSRRGLGRRTGEVPPDGRRAAGLRAADGRARALRVHRGLLEDPRSEARDPGKRVSRGVREARGLRRRAVHAGRGPRQPDRPRHGVHPRRARRPTTASARSTPRTRRGRRTPRGRAGTARTEVKLAQHAGGSNANQAAASERVTGEGTSIKRAAANWVESWTYLRGDLPKAIPYQELKVQFVTKEGYGKNVLQREPNVVTAIERAKKVDRQGELRLRVRLLASPRPEFRKPLAVLRFAACGGRPFSRF